MPEVVPQLYDLTELAKALKVSPHTISAWVRQGRLRPLRICRRLLFDPADVQNFLAQARNASSGTPDHLPIWGER